MDSYRETVSSIPSSMLQRLGEKMFEPKRLSSSRDNEENVIGYHGLVLFVAVGQLALF